MLDVHSVHSMTPMGNYQSEGKRKSKGKKVKGDTKAMNNVGKNKNEKRKVKFPCKICTNNHLTHQFPWLEEAQKLFTQQHPVVLTNPFPQEKNMAQYSSSMNAPGGNQGAPAPNSNNGAMKIYIMRSNDHL